MTNNVQYFFQLIMRQSRPHIGSTTRSNLCECKIHQAQK